MVEAIHVVVPPGIDDPARPSGGNRYDRRVIDELRALGRTVQEHPAAALEPALAGLPDGAVVVVDGLLACFAPEAIEGHAARLHVVVLLHMPFAEADPALVRSERAALAAAAGVVTTSDWARDWVVAHHGLAQELVATAHPGVDPALLALPSPGGGRLLCLAAATRAKGQDVLLAALAEVGDLDWTLTCVGSLDLEPDLVAGLRELALRSGLADRVHFTGPLGGRALDAALGTADLLVSAARHESYGMAVTEGLARGVPALVSAVGGHAEAVGDAGVLLPVDDPDAWAAALRRWLTDAAERERLRAAAAARRTSLGTWAATAQRLLTAVDPDALPSTSPTASR